MECVVRTPGQLGPILRDCRNLRRLSQREAGEKVGLKQATVSLIETDAGRPGIATLFRLLSALDLELVVRERVGVRESAPEW